MTTSTAASPATPKGFSSVTSPSPPETPEPPPSSPPPPPPAAQALSAAAPVPAPARLRKSRRDAPSFSAGVSRMESWVSFICSSFIIETEDVQSPLDGAVRPAHVRLLADVLDSAYMRGAVTVMMHWRCSPAEARGASPAALVGRCASRQPRRAPFTSRTAPIQRSREWLNYGCRMSQPPRSPSPLTARLYDLEYPRSLGVYNTYQEVQSVVDTLADEQFPVQSTLIVGTDLKLMERVTGRRTWPKVISQGALSGLWMGLFLGLLLLLLSPGNLTVVLTSVLLGIIFFTVSSVIGYCMTGGQRDFTSMTATIPMQYELLVEHKHAAQAQRILAE